MGTKRSILMLGGSAQQVVAIRKAKELGYRTVVCDYLPDNPGQYEADVFYLESTTDKEKMLEIARKEQVDGVIAYSSDPAAPSAAYVATKMGLPTNPEWAIEAMSYKNLFRAHLQKHGFPCPQSMALDANTSTDELLKKADGFSWPLVIKPTDSSGSKGVGIVASPAEMEDALCSARSFSRNGVLIVEEYIERSFPFVIGGDVFVVDGRVEFWGLMACLRDGEGALVPCGKMMPPGLTAQQSANVKACISKLVESLGIRFGELNVEVLIGKDDVPYVLELASRAGGNMIPVELSDASGLDLIGSNILCAMGENPGDLSFESSAAPPTLTYVLHSALSGSFDGVRYSETAKQAIYRECLYKALGDKVEKFTGADKALGIVFAKFDTEDALRDFVHTIKRHIEVLVGESQ